MELTGSVLLTNTPIGASTARATGMRSVRMSKSAAFFNTWSMMMPFARMANV